MPLEQIISIIVFFLVLVFIWGFFKKIFKLLYYAGIIITLLLAANLYFIYQDFRDLRENFGVSEKKVVLKDGSGILTGLLLNEDASLMTNQQLNDYSIYLKNNDYKKILDNSYKLMIFDVEIISSLDNEIDLGYKAITPNEAVSILKSDASQEEKASLFSIILTDEILSSKNTLFFFSEFKEGNIIIYPETALFKTVKLVPIDLFKNIA